MSITHFAAPFGVDICLVVAAANSFSDNLSADSLITDLIFVRSK
jgi:hypothetical protein